MQQAEGGRAQKLYIGMYVYTYYMYVQPFSLFERQDLCCFKS